MNRATFFILSILISATSVMAKETILSQVSKSDSVATDPMVKEFTLRVQHKELKYSFDNFNPHYIAKMVASVETYSHKNLPKYAVVQFIRGCIFNTSQNQDNSITYSLKNGRFYYDGYSTFKHKQWVLDTVDKDPIYWSSYDNNVGRIGLYRLDDPMFYAPVESRQFLYKHFENHTKSYVNDIPEEATKLGNNEYRNVSMEFRTCLYKISDLPAVTDASGKEILGKELICLSWKNSNIYDFNKKEFRPSKSIHPYCLIP